MHVSSPELHRKLVSELDSLDTTQTGGIRSPTTPSTKAGSIGCKDSWLSPPKDDESSSWASRSRSTGELKKEERIAAKRAAIDAMREQDQRTVHEVVEAGKRRRDARFHRLLEEVEKTTPFARQTATQLHNFEKQLQRRSEKRHGAWQAAVEEPIAEQLERFDDDSFTARKARQQWTGVKTATVKAPDEVFTIKLDVTKDPLRRSLAAHAWEDAFDREAEAVLSATKRSPPLEQLRATTTGRASIPRARSRPVLEPRSWGQNALQATPYGRFAQVTELGPGARLGKKAACGAGGDPAAFLISEADGVEVAGKRAMLETGSPYGILEGDWAVRGEAAQFKTALGASSGAPVQDHYQYERGNAIMMAEFPVGKRHFTWSM